MSGNGKENNEPHVDITLTGLKSTNELLQALREMREEIAAGELTDPGEIGVRIDLAIHRWAESTGA